MRFTNDFSVIPIEVVMVGKATQLYADNLIDETYTIPFKVPYPPPLTHCLYDRVDFAK